MTIKSSSSSFSPTRRGLLTAAALSTLAVPAFSKPSQKVSNVSGSLGARIVNCVVVGDLRSQ